MPMAPSPYWGDEVDLGQPDQRPQPDVRREGPGLVHLARPSAGQSGLLQEGSDHPSAKLFPLEQSGRQLAMYDPKTGKLTHISTCFGTHHLMFAEDANNTLWTSAAARSGVVGWLNTQDVRRDRRRGEVAGLDGAHPRHQRQRQARRLRRAEPAGRSHQGQADRGAPSTASRRTGRRLDLGHRCSASPAPVVRLEPGANPPETALAEIYEPPFPGLLAARHGHRSQRRRLGGAGERPPGQLRPPQVQGAAERPDGDGPALPRGLDALPVPCPQFEGRDRLGQRRGELLHLGRSVRHVRPGQRTCRSTPATPTRRCWR